MTNVNENSRPNLNILKQYIKDLSYENPLSLDLIQSQQNLNNVFRCFLLSTSVNFDFQDIQMSQQKLGAFLSIK